MDLRIGIQNSPRELGFETSQTAAEVEQAVSAALSGQSPVLRLTDSKGTVYVVPAVVAPSLLPVALRVLVPPLVMPVEPPMPVPDWDEADWPLIWPVCPDWAVI